MLAVLLLAGTALTSCTHSDDPAPEPQPSGPKTYTLTIRASKSSDTALTRALSVVGNDISSTWTAGDVVSVYKGDDPDPLGTLRAKNLSDDGKTCDLVGSLTTAPNVDDVLTLKYLSPSYDAQDGTLQSIAENCDYSTATVTVSEIVDNNVVIQDDPPIAFTNQQIIVKFTLKDTDGSALPSNPTALTIDYLTGSVSLTGISTTTYSGQSYSNGNGVLYVAVPNHIRGKDMKLTATVGSKTYTYWKSNAFQNNEGNQQPPVVKDYYIVNVKMFDPFSTPLTFECFDDEPTQSSVAITGFSDLFYSIDGGNNWSNCSGLYNNQYTFTSSVSKISFRGKNATNSGSIKFLCSGNCYVYGNIMSLVGGLTKNSDNQLITNDFSELKDLQDDKFNQLFWDEDYWNAYKIFSHPSKELVLPATTLTEDCYKLMFDQCVNLVRAPELPATEVIYINNAYGGMFNGCSNLNYIKCLATRINLDFCTSYWVYGVASSGTFVVNSSMTINDPMNPTTSTVNNGTEPLWSRGDSGIPIGWTVTK